MISINPNSVLLPLLLQKEFCLPGLRDKYTVVVQEFTGFSVEAKYKL
ncbi:hypothetical protein [uncultured Pontibacter sp.]|nr:hypothetical protein [uncultured Pontibacter sp.]